MSGIKKYACLLLLFAFLVLPSVGSAAQTLEQVVESSIKESLLAYKLSPKLAGRYAGDNLFIAMVMLRDTEGKTSDKSASEVGGALGKVIGATYLAYGEKGIPRSVSVMMNAVRAGIQPALLASAFQAMAQNNYPIEKTVALLHDLSEATMTASLRDNGSGLCKSLILAAQKQRPYQDLQKQIVLASKLQNTLTKQTLLAKAEEEKKKAYAARRRSQGGGSGTSSSEGASLSGSGGGGVSVAASAGKSGSSGRSGNASPSGGAPSGGSSSGGGSSGAESGGSSGGGNSGGESGGSSGGGNSGGESGGSSGGGNSGGESGGSSGGGNSGGESGGSSGGDSSAKNK